MPTTSNSNTTKKSKVKPESTTKQQTRAAKKLLAQASDLLEEVDSSYLILHQKRQSHQPQGLDQYPTFHAKEVRVGKLLGVGGFCKVFQVSDFDLSESETTLQNETTKPRDNDKPLTVESPDTNTTQSSNDHHHNNPQTPPLTVVSNGLLTKIEEETPTDDSHTNPKELVRKKGHDDQDDDNDSTDEGTGQIHHHHYDVKGARQFMKEHVKRNGDARYAIKRLHKDLTQLERVRGMIDLALEAKFLSALWHPNIIKMRGIASGDMLNREFFIIMDRLYATLSQRLKDWRSIKNEISKGTLSFFGFGSASLYKKPEMQQLTIERMTVAYDLAAAFRYMHDNKLVYRDMKKENIGFDVRGDVKIFDFGLSKCLSEKARFKDSCGRPAYGYNLTPRTGSIPFMAPEVCRADPYSVECDVFSFAILLWELLALKPAYSGYSRREYMDRVVRNKERPSIHKHWPPLTRFILSEAWDDNPQKRPTMKRFAAMIRGDLNDMSSDSSIQNRTKHMKDRSAHSFRLSRRIVSDRREAESQHNT